MIDPLTRRLLLGSFAAAPLAPLLPPLQDGRPNRRRGPTPSQAAIREGQSFRVLCHYGDGAAASLALSVAESTWRPAALAYGASPRTTEERIRVHLYGTRAEFDRACIALAGRTWPGHSGLTSARYGISLVLVGEGLSPEVLRGLGPRESDLWTVAHECSHLVGQRVSASYADHPDWLREGLAEAVAQQVMTERAGREGPPPIAATRDAAAAGAMRRARGAGLRNLLNGAPPGRDVFEQYAVQGAFVRFLESRPEVLTAALAGTQPSEELASLGPAFEDYLRTQTPAWGLGPGHFEREGRHWLQVGLVRERAWAWSLPPRPSARFWALATKFTVDRLGRAGSAWLALARRSVRERPDRWSETLQAIELPPGGVPRLVELTYGPELPAGGELRELAAGTGVRVPAAGATVPLEVTWSEGEVRLALSGTVALAAKSEAPALEGDWGLGADAGTVVRWRR